MGVAEPSNLLVEEDFSALELYFHKVDFPASTCIFKAGSPGDCCYIIDQGQVRVELDRSEPDSDHVLGFVQAGSIFGEVSLLDGMPRSASAYAHTNVQARKITAEDIAGLRESNPRALASLYAALGRNAASKLRHANEHLGDVVFSDHDPEVDELIARAEVAQKEIQDWPDARVDALLLAMAQSIAVLARELAESTVRITRVGNVPDKTAKNIFASMGVYRSMVGKPAYGPLNTDETRKVTEIAAPAGIIFGLIPMTNPVATAVFKALACVKSRNALILSFHRVTGEVGSRVGEILQGALRSEGAPINLVQWIRHGNSRKKTEMFMRHPRLSLVLATGGASMVKAAYASGTPTIGVGPGNAPTLICEDANLRHAAQSVVLSKSFDNGLVCGSDNNLVVVVPVREAFVAELIEAGAAVLTPEEVEQFTARVVVPGKHEFRNQILGKSAADIAARSSIARNYPIKLIVVPTEGVTKENAYAGEKMAPIVSLFTVANEQEGVEVSLALLQHEGTGHTAIIHTQNPELVSRFAAAMPASRVLVNSPGSHGVIGITTGLTRSLTLGCGTFGNNSTTDNISYRNLLNIKRLAHYLGPLVGER